MGSDARGGRPSGAGHPIVGVCGLMREAGLLTQFAVDTVIGGGVRAVLDRRLHARSAEEIAGIISVGICGALDPTLKVGDCVIGLEIVAGSVRLPVDAKWLARLANRLPDAHTGPIAGTDGMLVEAAEKQSLRHTTNALAADMESHVAAEFAAKRDIPFAALRVVSDDASQALPPAVLNAMNPDGGVNVLAVMSSLLRNPRQLPALLRTARDSDTAFKALLRCLDRLGPRLLGPNLG